MKIQSAVDEYLVEIEVRKDTPKTIRSYRCNLNLFLRFCAEKWSGKLRHPFNRPGELWRSRVSETGPAGRADGNSDRRHGSGKGQGVYRGHPGAECAPWPAHGL